MLGAVAGVATVEGLGVATLGLALGDAATVTTACGVGAEAPGDAFGPHDAARTATASPATTRATDVLGTESMRAGYALWLARCARARALIWVTSTLICHAEH